jgi:hypothetical protein
MEKRYLTKEGDKTLANGATILGAVQTSNGIIYAY